MVYKAFLHTHSFVAFIALALVIIASVNAIIGFFKKRTYTQKDLRLGLFALIFTHIQVLLGVVLYLVSPLRQSWSLGMKQVTGDSYLRKMLLEHPMMTIFAVIFITIGWSLHKKEKTPQRTFGKIALFYSTGAHCLLYAIPWDRWF